MARVRVLAVKVDVAKPTARLAYSAQVYSEDEGQVIWTCQHEHRTPLAAQTCGVQRMAAMKERSSQRPVAPTPAEPPQQPDDTIQPKLSENI